MINKPKNKIGKLVALCYIVCVAVWLLLAIWRFAADKMAQQSELLPNNAKLEDMVPVAESTWQTQSIDAKMIWTNINADIRTIWVGAKFSEEPGEVEVFFTRSEGEDFSVQNRGIAQPFNGGWLVRLPAGHVANLRIDAGIENNNLLTISGIVLNPRLDAAHYFVPSLRDVLLLLFAPLLACCAIIEIRQFIKA